MITSTGNVAHCLNAGGMGRQDFETETMVAHTLLGKENSSHQADRETYIAFDCKASGQAGFGVGEIAPTLRAMGHLHGNQNAGGQIAVAHTLKGEGFDASEDGTGRGTPIVPVAFRDVAQALTSNYGKQADNSDTALGPNIVAHAIQAGALRENPNSGPDGVGVQEGVSFTLEARAEVQAVAFDTTQITSKANFSNPQIGDPCHPLASRAHPPAVAWSIMPQNSGKDYKARAVDVAQPLMAGGPVGGNQGGDYIQQQWAVRRLTPTECERLQGFPDNFTNVPWGKKDTSPDGPRYKALGNSMAVNCMRWIGKRIQMVEDIIAKQEDAA